MGNGWFNQLCRNTFAQDLAKEIDGFGDRFCLGIVTVVLGEELGDWKQLGTHNPFGSQGTHYLRVLSGRDGNGENDAKSR